MCPRARTHTHTQTHRSRWYKRMNDVSEGHCMVFDVSTEYATLMCCSGQDWVVLASLCDMH